MPLELRPLSNRIVVSPDEPEKMSAGGIHIPDTAKHIPQMGTIVAIGPGRYNDVPVYHPLIGEKGGPRGDSPWIRQPMDLRVGQRIFFAKNAGSIVQIERDSFVVLRETEVLALVVEVDDAATPSDD